ncbi:intraflagellar transport-associated protein isoform X6 [Callorhinus ursinus]|uniref:intraflagellar transport-associated protein isoform X6 n=1 Tax=Callorhinus ursinus TaxID=34884 RepID=UPI003CD01295
MPAQISELEIMDEDQLIEEVLDKFVNCHEQTYEEFLSTFTHLSKDSLLLPGEVEEDLCTRVPSYIPSVAQPFASGFKPGPAVGGGDKQTEETLGDEVQPFSLDEEFDYDVVTLTPKFTPAELDVITELSKQKREVTNTDLEGPRG